MDHDTISPAPEQDQNATPTLPRDVERLIDISGSVGAGRPKAHMFLRHYVQYFDGSTRDIEAAPIDKPIVNIFQHAGFVNVFLDFGRQSDMDLKIVWDIIHAFTDVRNSVSYLPEELASGEYQTEAGPQMVYYPVLELILSPIGREDEYAIHGYNPAFVTLAPNGPNGEICVLQLTFHEDTFSVVNHPYELDPSRIQAEIEEELEAEKRGHYSQY